MRTFIALIVLFPSVGVAAPVDFSAGSLIIPMDVDYQDAGMLKAFGLVDKLLRAGVPVSWCINPQKQVTDTAGGRFTADFTATTRDVRSGATVGAHAYRGGPFVIAAADAGAAAPVIVAWITSNVTTVHQATQGFTAPVARVLTAAPRIAVLADGNQKIAYSYLNAAGILDEAGAVWIDGSPDVLLPAQVAGPSPTNPSDGALFRPSGQPAFCEIMTMHWAVTSTDVPAVTAEMGSFLQFPVHLNAECQAVNAIEGAPPTGGRMKFVAPQGFVWPAPARPNAVQFSNSALPFAQMDGPFGTIGGSEPAYQLPAGTSYYDSGIVMVRAAGQPIGSQDVWMTGFAGGKCPITPEGNFCLGSALGKVSYLGGHQYSVATPMTANPTTQGARLFLNSLYEAGCVTSEGQPRIAVTKDAPMTTSSSTVTFSITVSNAGVGPALGAVLTDALPSGAAFVSASAGGSNNAGVVTWKLGDLAAGASVTVTVDVKLSGFGKYSNSARASFTVGLNTKTATSNTTSTVYGPPADMAVGPVDMSTPPFDASATVDQVMGAGGGADASRGGLTDGPMSGAVDFGAGGGMADAAGGGARDAAGGLEGGVSSLDAAVTLDGPLARDGASVDGGAAPVDGAIVVGSDGAANGGTDDLGFITLPLDLVPGPVVDTATTDDGGASTDDGGATDDAGRAPATDGGLVNSDGSSAGGLGGVGAAPGGCGCDLAARRSTPVNTAWFAAVTLLALALRSRRRR